MKFFARKFPEYSPARSIVDAFMALIRSAVGPFVTEDQLTVHQRDMALVLKRLSNNDPVTFEFLIMHYAAHGSFPRTKLPTRIELAQMEAIRLVEVARGTTGFIARGDNPEDIVQKIADTKIGGHIRTRSTIQTYLKKHIPKLKKDPSFKSLVAKMLLEHCMENIRPIRRGG